MLAGRGGNCCRFCLVCFILLVQWKKVQLSGEMCRVVVADRLIDQKRALLCSKGRRH
jgi:hypothetical protein